jgi:2-polyprenyl-3-methyl-5-hydroxy-6-metoxy-1,4-benzoquinol methylase
VARASFRYISDVARPGDRADAPPNHPTDEPSDETRERSDAATPTLDDLVAELRARVERRRRESAYPADLEETLDEHFERLVGGRPAASPAVYEVIENAVDSLEHFEYSRSRIDAGSEVPGGDLAHRLVGKVVSRQVQGVLEQSQAHAHLIAQAVSLIAHLATSVGHEFDGKVLQQLDDIQVRLAGQQRDLTAMVHTLEEIGARVPGIPVDVWYREDKFTAYFRGGADDLRNHYRGLAAELIGCDPVVDIGFGRGEFLELLREMGVQARGVEADPELVEMARGRGLDVEEGRGVEHLASLADASLGGVVMTQVIEHLSPQHVIDFVRLAADKVRPGGRVIVETINPQSLYTYARAFWIDPDHMRPVHPAFLMFLFQEAGFVAIRREDRSPVPDNEALELLPGDDELTKRLNANFERLNALVFGAQDYALIATR